MGIMKKVAVLVVIFSIALTGKSLGLSMEGFLVWAIAIITVSELYSILQNCYAIMTGVILTEFDTLSYTIKKLGEKVRSTLEQMIELPTKK